MKNIKKLLFRHKFLFVFLFIIIFILIYKVSDYFYISKYTHIQENISEQEYFRNPEMKDGTLLEIKKLSEQKKLNFEKLAATAFLVNNFELSKININKIDINRYNKIYKKIKKDKDFLEYLNSVKAILSDIRYFPVAMDKKQNYQYSFEDSFGSSRSYNGNYSHEGTDIMAGVNESGIYPIVSVCDGVVENIGWLPKGGYRVGIRGNHGGYFYYAHLHTNSITVKKGETVKAGQMIGYMGDTGYGAEGTTGKFPVHLHFGMYIKTKNYEELSVNPYYILRYLENYPVYENY